MPGMSGLELGHLIASRQSPVPVIMVTAVRDRGLERAAAKGPFCLLKKPVGTDSLIECLQRALEG
jgi:FixJ family two-component response regulator